MEMYFNEQIDCSLDSFTYGTIYSMTGIKGLTLFF